jgi:hypothetical protein
MSKITNTKKGSLASTKPSVQTPAPQKKKKKLLVMQIYDNLIEMILTLKAGTKEYIVFFHFVNFRKDKT